MGSGSHYSAIQNLSKGLTTNLLVQLQLLAIECEQLRHQFRLVFGMTTCNAQGHLIRIGGINVDVSVFMPQSQL